MSATSRAGWVAVLRKLADATRAGPRCTPVTLTLAVIVLAAADTGVRPLGYPLAAGVSDVIAHLATTLLVLWALGRSACERLWVPALTCSVLIDADHIPGRLGVDWLTAGTQRPYTHSLLTIAVVLAGVLVWPRRRDLFLGAALGLAIHFWRDLSEPYGGVPLLWPASYHSFRAPYSAHLISMVAVVAVNGSRCLSRRN